jgi:hypothetical protein
MKIVEAYETIDGQRFIEPREAEEHEILLQLQCFYINHYTNDFTEALEMAKQIYKDKEEISKILMGFSQYDLSLLKSEEKPEEER